MIYSSAPLLAILDVALPEPIVPPLVPLTRVLSSHPVHALTRAIGTNRVRIFVQV